MPGETLEEKANYYWTVYIPSRGGQAPEAVSGNKFCSTIIATWKVLSR